MIDLEQPESIYMSICNIKLYITKFIVIVKVILLIKVKRILKY